MKSIKLFTVADISEVTKYPTIYTKSEELDGRSINFEGETHTMETAEDKGMDFFVYNGISVYVTTKPFSL